MANNLNTAKRTETWCLKLVFCRVCGKNLPSDDIQFCPGCGSVIKDNTSTIFKDTSIANQSKSSSGVKNSHKAIIIVVIVILFFLVIISWGAYNVGKNRENAQAHAAYCTNWKNTLDKNKAQLESNTFRGDAEVAQFNAETTQYNKECAF
jgi:uncharacterized membrane protein YvbJ